MPLIPNEKVLYVNRFACLFNDSPIRCFVLTHFLNFQLDWQLQLSLLDNLPEPLQ